MSLVRDPVVAESFFAKLPGDSLSPEEARLLKALLALGEAACALGLPAGVSLQEWAERRVPGEWVGAVNATGLVFIPGKNDRPPTGSAIPRSSSFRELGTGAAEALKATVVRSIVVGVKTIGSTMLGAMMRLNKKEEEPEKLEAVENTFYYDTMQKRWRQHGVEDADVSQIDPMTGRPKAPELSAAHLPPPPSTPTSGSLNKARNAARSLYVDPLASKGPRPAWHPEQGTAAGPPVLPDAAMSIPVPALNAACSDMRQYSPPIPPVEEVWHGSGQVAGDVPFPAPDAAVHDEHQDDQLLDPPRGKQHQIL